MRLRARRDLKPQELTILKELLDWRELTAARLDRPPFKVMTDDRLISDRALATTGSARLAGRRAYGADRCGSGESKCSTAVSRGLCNPLVGRRTAGQRPDAAYLKRLEVLKEWRKKVAARMEVESDVVLPRALLLALADRGAQEAARDPAVHPRGGCAASAKQIAAVLQSTPSN